MNFTLDRINFYKVRGAFLFQLTQLALNKSHLASRLEEIESTNIDLVTRISAIRGKETMIMEQEFTSVTSPAFSPPRHGSPLSTFFADVELCVPSETDENKHFFRQGSASSDPGEQPLGIHSVETFAATRRNLNSSPDLGIESDPGRFSSLEANHLISGDRIGTSGTNFFSSSFFFFFISLETRPPYHRHH